MQKKSKLNVFTFMMLIILGLTFQPAISTHAACPDDISSYWKLDEANGPTYTDFISDNDGTESANPTAATGTVNGAQAFNGTNAGIDVPADLSFNWLSSDSFSIEAWVKIDTGIPGSNQVIVGRKDAGAPDISWFIAVDGDGGTGKALFTLKDDNLSATIGAAGTINVADGSWHHVVAVRDDSAGATGRNLLYVDGILQEESADIDYADGFFSTSAEINIGWLNFPGVGEFRFVGLIDEVALYNRALPLSEIQTHNTNGLVGIDYCEGTPAPSDAPFPDDTISLWKLDETNGPDYLDSFDDNDGTGSADPTAATGTVNGAQAFNGTNAGIDVPADLSFNWLSSDSFSIEAWVKIDTGIPGSNQVIVGRKDAGAPDISWFIAVDGDGGTGKALFALKDDNLSATIGTAGTINVADGSWHHVVAVRDDSAGATGRNLLYVDGILQEESADIDYADGFFSTSAEINIGWFNFPGIGEFRFEGLIDEVALYGRALTTDEIEDHYGAGLLGNGIDDLGGGIAEIIGTYSNGTWYRDIAESSWTQMTSSITDGDIAAGDFTGDGKADVASIWPSGLWYQDGDTLAWTEIPGGAPNKVTAGDVTGDGRAEIIGTWSNGIWYRDVAASNWTKMTSGVPDGDIAAGDFTGDGKADVASSWPSGLWYQDGATLAWTKVGTAPNSLAAGDVTGDGRAEIIGIWNDGIWYRDVAASSWIQMTTSTTTGDIAAGDFTGDGKAEVASIWSNALWYQDGDTLAWTKVTGGAPKQMTAGDVTGQ